MDKLTISQIDPTSKCGNYCKHCGDNANLKGEDPSTSDVRLLLESDHFQLKPKSPGVPELGNKINILGGGGNE